MIFNTQTLLGETIMNMNKSLLALAMILGALSSQNSMAAPILCGGGFGGTANDSGTQTLGYWSGLSAEGCFQQDKLYKDFVFSGSSLPGSNFRGQIFFEEIGIQDTHTVNWTMGLPSTGLNFNVSYNVSVFGNPNAYISEIRQGATVGTTGAFIADTITGVGGPYSLQSPTNGNPDIEFTTGNPTTLNVTTAFNSTTGSLNNGATIFVESGVRVPEPETLALFSIGLLALIANVRRRK